jgi:hypothetical protein
MRVLIAAGGTGGHIYPGIAVANEIMRRDPASVVRFVGTARGLENRLVPQAGFELSLIESAGLVNMGLMQRLRGLAILPKSLFAARGVIKAFGPDVVVGAGGYVSGPVLMMASLMRLPTVLMESNAVPGFTNRQLARFVDAAAVSFEAALPYFTGKGIKGWLVKMFRVGTGQVPIDRSGGRAARVALEVGLGILRSGGIFGIYPEGTRSPDGRLYRGKTGVARLALEGRAPVIPCAMLGTYDLQRPGTVMPRLQFRPGTRFGKPLDFSRYAGMQDSLPVLRSVTDQIVYNILELSGQDYVDNYQASATAA